MPSPRKDRQLKTNAECIKQVQLLLKAIVRGYSNPTTPITWRNRRTGVAKLKIKEIGSMYVFICIYNWLERYFFCVFYYKNICF